MDMDPENAAINSRASKDTEHFPLLANEDEPKPKKKGFFRIDPNETPILIAFGFEFIGTFILVYVGCGAIISNIPSAPVAGAIFAAIVFGLIVAFQAKSGAHFNPAVSLAMAITRNVSIRRAIVLIISQCLGAILAGFLLRLLANRIEVVHLGVTDLAAGISQAQGVGLEAISTFIFLTVIFRTGGTHWQLTEYKANAPFAVAFTLFANIAFIGPYTGASLNPARSLGPAVAVNYWNNHWVFWIGPLVGAAMAGGFNLLYHTFTPLKVEIIE